MHFTYQNHISSRKNTTVLKKLSCGSIICNQTRDKVILKLIKVSHGINSSLDIYICENYESLAIDMRNIDFEFMTSKI